MRLEKLPAEVWLRLGRRRKDLWCLAVYAKSQCSCAHAWGETLAYGRTIGVRDKLMHKGWRRAHTDHYYVWWAFEFDDLAALAVLCPPEHRT